MNVTKRIKLDFGRATSPVSVWVKQGDENSRKIEIEPMLNGVTYAIPSGVSARFACRKPDGHQVLNDCPAISGNIITIPLTPQTLAEAGEGLASVILFDNVNQSILSTQNFILRIEENPLVGSEVESSDEYQSFLAALGKMDSDITEILRAIYPVGAIYISYTSTSPAILFGGSWTQIQGRFLLAADSTYTAGSTGGEATHALTVDEMPAHTHSADFWSSKSGDAGYAGTPATNFDSWNRPTERATASVKETGGGQAHNNMPPYLAVYMWRRTA